MAAKTNRDMLRHTVATLAYRGGKAVANAPRNFAAFKNGGIERGNFRGIPGHAEAIH